MKKKYYEITTHMDFVATVYVPVDDAEDEFEAQQMVSDAVEANDICMFSHDADCYEVYNRIIETEEKDIPNYFPVITKEKEED